LSSLTGFMSGRAATIVSFAAASVLLFYKPYEKNRVLSCAADPAGGAAFRTALSAPPSGKWFVTAPNG